MRKYKPTFLQKAVSRAIRNLLNRACQPPRSTHSQSQSTVQKNERSQGVPDLMRILVLHRDQQRCVLCGRSSGEVSLEVAHIIPFSQGGNNDLDNLQTLCQDCHCGKKSDSC